MAQLLRLLSPCGNRVTVGLPDKPAVASVAASVRFAGGSLARGFSIGPRGYQKFAATYLVQADTADRFVVNGREVVVTRQVNGAGSAAAMIGEFHELYTVFGGPAPARETIISLFSTLAVTDEVEGMTVKPAKTTLVDAVQELLTVTVPGRGRVTIPGARYLRSYIPAHRGQATRFGEVWRGNVPGVDTATKASDHLYTMGFRRGVGEVHLAPDDTTTDDALYDWMNELNVEWAADVTVD